METIHSLNDLEERVNEEDICLLLVKSDSCSVCDAVEHQMEEGMLEDTDLPVMKAWMTDVPELSGKYLVFSAPTIILFIFGKEYWRGSRFISFEDLNRQIKAFRESQK